MAEHRSGFWSTLPGILTGVAAVITAVGGIYFALNRPQGAVVMPPASTSRPAELNDAQPEPAAPGNAEVRATVVDPDGWTNLRSGPSLSSAVIGRVDEGEVFWARPGDGSWWRVRTANGLDGYVHRSRIRLNP
jgi:uncharacterized protein YgiM (DUF1202 family)